MSGNLTRRNTNNNSIIDAKIKRKRRSNSHKSTNIQVNVKLDHRDRTDKNKGYYKDKNVEVFYDNDNSVDNSVSEQNNSSDLQLSKKESDDSNYASSASTQSTSEIESDPTHQTHTDTEKTQNSSTESTDSSCDTCKARQNQKIKMTSDEISSFISRIQNKYSNNAEQKHLNQMYDIGILIVNKEFNKDKLIDKLTKIIEKRSWDPLKKVREHKKKTLLNALQQGIDDAMSDEYRFAYNISNRYSYDSDKLKKRARIDSVLENFYV